MGKGGSEMKLVTKIFFISLWIVVLTFIMTYVWFRAPVLWFPSPPEVVWQYLEELFNVLECSGSGRCIGKGDLELMVGFVYGFLAALLITCISWLVWLTIRSSGR